MASTAFLYDAGGIDRSVEPTAALVAGLNHERLLWIDIDERDPAAVQEAARLLDLDPEGVAILSDPDADARLENYGRYIQFRVAVAPAATSLDTDATDRPRDARKLDFVVGKDWLLTVHDGPVSFLESFRAQGKAETMIGSLTSQALSASLLDWHLESFFGEVARIEAIVDRLDERALAETSSATLLARMVGVRRHISRIRSLLAAQRSVFYGLARPDFQVVTEAGASPHFQALVGRFERAIDEVEHSRDLVVGSFELFATRTSQQTNDLVRTLTFVTVVLGACAAVAGILGMNFEVSFFRYGDAGFEVVVALMLMASIVAFVFAKRRRWI